MNSGDIRRVPSEDQFIGALLGGGLVTLSAGRSRGRGAPKFLRVGTLSPTFARLVAPVRT